MLIFSLSLTAVFAQPSAAQNLLPTADQPPPSEAPASPPANASAAAPQTADPVDILLQVLEDPDARARLIERLRLRENQASPAPEPGAAPPSEEKKAITEESPSFTVYATELLNSQFQHLVRFTVDAVDISRFWGWASIQAKSDELRNFWIDFIIALGICVGASLSVYGLVRLALSTIRHTIQSDEMSSLGARVWLRTAVAVLDLLPVGAYVAVAAAALALVEFPRRTELVGYNVVWIVGLGLLTVFAARMILRPASPYLRLVQARDDVAAGLYKNVRQTVTWLVIGLALFENIEALGIPKGIFAGLARIWGLVIVYHVLKPFFVYRAEISAALTGTSQIRRFIAAIWLPVVSVYTLGTFLIWATEVQNAFDVAAQGGAITLLVLLAVQPATAGLKTLSERIMVSDSSDVDPVIQERVKRYVPLFNWLAKASIYVLAAVAIGLAWGLQPAQEFSDILDTTAISVVTNILLICVVCWVVWEVSDLAFALYLRGNVEDTGRTIQRSARARTLIPLFRTVIVVVLILAFIGAALSSFGLDIAPLLATAGIAGIAIGFGAQKLVQDVITGLFILFQNTISIGDIVELGGVAGTVERLTIRTIELRDLEGSLHTIPFSEVSTVKNMTRDFAFALVDVGVAYRENTDHVMEVLRHIGAELETDPTHGPNILSALEVMGVHDLADSAVVIRCRYRVLPKTQFAVRRAFMGLVKRRFDELGIEIPFPQRTLHWAPPYEHPAFQTETGDPAAQKTEGT